MGTNVYKVTYSITGGPRGTVYRVYKEDLDTVYICLRKAARLKFGKVSVFEFECVLISSHSPDYLKVMYERSKRNRYTTDSVFDVLIKFKDAYGEKK